MTDLSLYNLDSGKGLKEFLDKVVQIDSFSGLDGSQNYIILPDKTSFNWKSSQEKIRINCKDESMVIIEKNTSLTHFENVKGDPTRPNSFWISNMADFVDAIAALRKIEINRR